ncbi:unnamed protein product [Kluyveromyces dobzhanskii CBS 2104]|uniref:WGS project CCBQ000000000 data, contig 00107 n=1 Tax=Kluyveromyces dobzhanskii CBS 2104 TaxID=1427455 RepID=A0A0A8KZB0_9SACH|nr:unnamed protein product [Kluyveromyces dobzhanskii CBS 2104]
MDSGIDSGDISEKNNKASHSCSRCRRLKKKCSKDVDSCTNCSKANEVCDYPGRAPRRKRKEIEESMLLGELTNDKGANAKRVRAVGSKQATNDLGNGRRGTGKDIIEPGLRTSQQSLVSASSVSTFLNLLNTLNHTNGSTVNESNIREENGNESRHAGKKSDDGSEDRSDGKIKQERDAVISHGVLAEHERHRSESTPITASAIQIETVLSVFKGARTTPMKLPLNIERPLYDRFIAAFFKHNHKSYPLMNKVEFLNKVSTIRDFNKLSDKESNTFIFQLYMIMAIGCTTLQRAGMLTSEEEGLSEHFAYMAMKIFCPVMYLQNLETIKSLLLLGIYSFFEPKGVCSWTVSGLIMRLCIGFGLNRALTPKKLKTMSVIDVEMRYRAFWAFYSFERLVATSLGRVSCLSDDDISVPLPRPLFEEEKDDIEVTNMMIALRRIGGRIYRKVHSVGAARRKLTIEEKKAVIDGLREELDDLYKIESTKIQNAKKETNNITFHHSDAWISMRYYQLQIMLYRPSALVPKPTMDSLTILGDACLRSLKYTYSLYQRKLLPLNWITLFRVLTICNTMLYCLCQWSIDIIESKIEIHQCIEVLRHFGAKWVFAAKCADVFSNIINTILDISLSNGRVPNMDKLTREVFGASNEYQEILDENNVDISWVDSIV